MYRACRWSYLLAFAAAAARKRHGGGALCRESASTTTLYYPSQTFSAAEYGTLICLGTPPFCQLRIRAALSTIFVPACRASNSSNPKCFDRDDSLCEDFIDYSDRMPIPGHHSIPPW